MYDRRMMGTALSPARCYSFAVDVTFLAEHPEHVDRIAVWQYGEWGFLDPEDTPGKRREKLEGHLHTDGLPFTLVALERPQDGPDGAPELVGSADLVHHDIPGRPDLTPWLSCVYVPPENRGRGIGGALTRRAVREAAGLGAPTLYLCTWERESFYRELGWTTLERFTAGAWVCVIMEIATGDPVPTPDS